MNEKPGRVVCVSSVAIGAGQRSGNMRSSQDWCVFHPNKRGNGVENIARSGHDAGPQRRRCVTREWGPQGVGISEW